MSDDQWIAGSSPAGSPDYELDDVLDATTPTRLRAIANPTRSLILDLVLERAMSVTELADRVDRSKGTVAHHVKVLVDAGLLRSVRSRRVRAVTEHFYGRTAATYVLPGGDDGDLPFFAEARAEADLELMRAASSGGSFTLRHARIPADRAQEFTERVMQLAVEFTRLPRDGDREYAFIAGVFPTRRLAPTSVREDR